MSIYPPADEIALALNDPGKKVEKTRKGKKYPFHKYPLIDKLSTKIFTAIKEKINPEGLTKNVSRGKQKLIQDILIERKQVDITETDVFFHKYAKDGMVYLVQNDTNLCGINKCVDHFQKAHEQQMKQKNIARTGNDGLRLACIMLDPQYRSSVSSILSKKKNRSKADISGDSNLHFFGKNCH